MKVKIIGCGLSGATAAVLLKDLGYNVEIFESRDHIGGNCYDFKIDDILVHKYGAHIFHTNDDQVWNFLNRFTKFNNYVHKVRANTELGTISIPYNKTTSKQIGRELEPKEIQDLIFRKYSERHWGISWDKLPRSIKSRVTEKRDNFDERYFTDKYQGIPCKGYTHLFQNMLDGIKINLGISSNESKKIIANSDYDLLIYTGKIDEFFNYEFGRLEYRSLRFEHFKKSSNNLFSWEKGAVINECNDKDYNRTVDNAVFLNQNLSYSIFTRDFPEEHDEKNVPIYPKNFGHNTMLFEKYNKLKRNNKKVLFLGRLATYKYLDMWMAVKQVFKKYEQKGINYRR